MTPNTRLIRTNQRPSSLTESFTLALGLWLAAAAVGSMAGAEHAGNDVPAMQKIPTPVMAIPAQRR